MKKMIETKEYTWSPKERLAITVTAGGDSNEKRAEKEWVSVEEQPPPLKKNILVAAKEGNYYPEVHGPKDPRVINMYVGHFYNDNEFFRKLKPNIKFEVDCGCSGPEFDRTDLEILYWMELPKLSQTNFPEWMTIPNRVDDK